jgi:hypothetical protein
MSCGVEVIGITVPPGLVIVVVGANEQFADYYHPYQIGIFVPGELSPFLEAIVGKTMGGSGDTSCWREVEGS